MSDVYERSEALLRSDHEADRQAGLELLRQNAESHPEDLHALFEYAGAFDFLGQTKEAAEVYGRVLAHGLDRLPPSDRPRFYIQYGSTLRDLKRFKESRRVLEEGTRKHAGYPALWAFLALTEYSCGEPQKAIQTLIEVLIQHPSHGGLSDYAQALRGYSKSLKTSEV